MCVYWYCMCINTSKCVSKTLYMYVSLLVIGFKNIEKEPIFLYMSKSFPLGLTLFPCHFWTSSQWSCKSYIWEWESILLVALGPVETLSKIQFKNGIENRAWKALRFLDWSLKSMILGAQCVLGMGRSALIWALMEIDRVFWGETKCLRSTERN